MKETAEKIIVEQQQFFASHQTRDLRFRLEQLRKLKHAVETHQKQIENALWEDLRKSPEETYLTEISLVKSEIDNHIKHLKKWSRPKRVGTPIHLFPSSSKVLYQPLGVALIVAPWNYPFQLLFNPLVAAISSGCCAVLKPSPDAPNTAKLMQSIIESVFDPHYISVVQGGRETNTVLLSQKFDVIFFTGSPQVGKVVMKAAAENLIPVILELGGKSPCIVDKDADLDIAAKRIAWGKLINAGQTCIAPDYLYAHVEIKDVLLEKIATQIEAMYGEDIKRSRFYPRIVNNRAFERLAGLLEEGDVVLGGETDPQARYISPTIIDQVQPNFKIMQEEIFGPILPVLVFEDIGQPLDYINSNEKPLAFYYFGKNKKAKQALAKTASGGACINDVILHVGNHNLPFGGVGNSGMGSYHGRDGFLAFSFKRAVLSTPTWFDLAAKYPPFKYYKWIKKFI